MLTNKVVAHIRGQFGAMGKPEAQKAIERLPRLIRRKGDLAKGTAVEEGRGIRKLSVQHINPHRRQVAIKLARNESAAEVISQVKQAVAEYNAASKEAKYTFQAPMLYAAGEHVLFMQVSKFPTLAEVLASKSSAKVNSVINLAAKRLGKTPEGTHEIITIYSSQILQLTNRRAEKLIFAGVKEGKLLFIPLV
ncbi:Uncharacterised protein [uncultured archaeon]|nr:Uncharacterised protein [uncultured archaeon]